MTATAKAVLQNRALQCSFSSVFHIKKTANTAKAFREAKEAEDIFMKAVFVPMAFMGLTGGAVYTLKN